MHYVGARDGKIAAGTERHRVAMFTREELLTAAADAGVVSSWDTEGLTDRGLLVGVRITASQAGNGTTQARAIAV